MASHQTLKASKREVSGSTVARRLRRSGIVPGVIYGSKQRTYGVQVNAREFADLLRKQSSDNFLINLEVEGANEKVKLVMVQDIQHTALSGAGTHAVFPAGGEGAPCGPPAHPARRSLGARPDGDANEHHSIGRAPTEGRRCAEPAVEPPNALTRRAAVG